jgi:uncharacterized small protein (DUF1192 family)
MSRDAVRMRIRRGSLASEKGEDGRVYVFVGPDQDRAHPQAEGEGSPTTMPLVEELRDRIEFLQRELERKDAILLNMTEAMVSTTARQYGSCSRSPHSRINACPSSDRGSTSSGRSSFVSEGP